MQSCSGTTLHRIDWNSDPASQDLDLVASVKAGSVAAFEELQRRYSRRLYNRIQSITRNHEDAEDALQDTFLRAYLALDSFEGRSQFSSWLTRIAINSALMVVRRRRTRAEVPFESPLESGEPALMIDVRDTALNPEQHCDLRQRFHCALHAIGKLSDNLRTPLTHWIEKECSIKELAQTLDLSAATVKARLHRARRQIRRVSASKECVANAGSIPGVKGRYTIAGFQNRELPCASCD